MRKSNEAIPEQLQEIWDLSEEVERGSFGMPTAVSGVNNILEIPGSSSEAQRYDLVEVIRLPVTEAGSPDGSEQHKSIRTRVFRPALETALGFRDPDDELNLGIVERELPSLIPHAYTDPSSGQKAVSNEHLAEDETYDSAYAAALGKFVTKIGINSIVNNRAGSERLQRRYHIGYSLRNKRPDTHINLRNPSHRHQLELIQLDSGQILSQLFRHRMPIPVPFQAHFRRPSGEEVDLMRVDLEQIKEEYRSWTSA